MGHYSIQAAAQISGISDACIRAWEKRYNSITPARNESNHRLYSDEDIERLTLFNKLTNIGMRISQLSSLDTEELKKIYLSVTKEKFSDTELFTKKSAVTFYQSLYIIEESFNAKRFDVAYHELKKVFELNTPIDISLKLIPALDGLCQNWKDKKITDAAQIDAFERFIHIQASQRAHREKQNFRDIKSLSISLESNKNRIADSGLEMLLTAHRMDNCLFSNERSTDFLLVLINIMKPKFVFLVAEHKDPEVIRVIESLVDTTTKIIVFDQKLPLLKTKADTIENMKVFNSIFEIDKYLENSLQF